MDVNDPNRLLTPTEVGELFQVDPKTVTRWSRAGKLPCVKTLGGHRRYRQGDIHAVIEASREGDVPKVDHEKPIEPTPGWFIPDEVVVAPEPEPEPAPAPEPDLEAGAAAAAAAVEGNTFASRDAAIEAEARAFHDAATPGVDPDEVPFS